VRRNARGGPVKLPAEGRQGDPPPWPLDGFSDAEAEAWDELWHTPHAVAWERMGWTRTVARYCRVLLEAEEPGANPNVRAEARQMEDKLGLTPKAMRMLLWEVVSDEVTEKRQSASSARKRIKAV
jgi:hypothetical protein